MLLCHKDIDVNASVNRKYTALSYMAHHGYKSLSGIELLLKHPNIHGCQRDSAYEAVREGHIDLLELIIKHPNFNVNKKCKICNSRLPIAYFESAGTFRN